MEPIQYNASLGITGAIRGMSKEKIYQEVSLEFLQLHFCHRKLSLYKVFKNEHTKYLFNLILGRGTPYVTRTVGNVPLLRQLLLLSITFSKIIFFYLLLLNGIT